MAKGMRGGFGGGSKVELATCKNASAGPENSSTASTRNGSIKRRNFE